MRSLRLKILALAALLVVLTQAGTVATVLFTANRDVVERARSKLSSTSGVMDLMLPVRPNQVRRVMQYLAEDRKFEAAVAAGDRPAVNASLAASRARGSADIALVLDAAGNVLAGDGGAGQAAVPNLIRRATELGLTRDTASISGATYDLVTIPLRASEGSPARWLSMGLALDDRRARLMRQMTGLEIAFVATDGRDARLLGTSLTASEQLGIGHAVLPAHAAPKTIVALKIAGKDYLGVGRPILPPHSDVEILLLESLDMALAPYRLLRLSVLAIGALALLVAFAGAAVVSRAMTQPVSRLVGAARRIREGDYASTVKVRAGDELAELADAFNTMQQGIAEREERITYQAQFDALTGMPNRLLALERLTECIDGCRPRELPVSALVVDLGNMGEVTASMGHEIGDALLSQAAERLRASVDARHTVARLEGHEFLVILQDHDTESALIVAEDLLRALGSGLSFRDVNLNLEPVIGIAAYPQHSDVADQLMLRASVARNDAKQAQQRLHVYQEGREERRVRQLSILGDLRRAVRHDELKLFLQPKISLRDNSVCGAEALVRWDHPTLGWLPPGEFIPIAEQSGNISLVTDWALTAAVRECRLWLEEGLRIPVSVNVSSRDLLNPGLPLQVVELLRDHDLPANLLTLEITEQALMRDFARATAVLQCLRELGVRIAIDDFGTGYSSLSQLKHLPVDELKIDRSFVMELPQDPADAAIVRAAVDLAHDLGLEVVAEGVETWAALRWLAERGCERAQGFLISRPMPAETLVGWVKRYSLTRPAWEPSSRSLSA